MTNIFSDPRFDERKINTRGIRNRNENTNSNFAEGIQSNSTDSSYSSLYDPVRIYMLRWPDIEIASKTSLNCSWLKMESRTVVCFPLYPNLLPFYWFQTLDSIHITRTALADFMSHWSFLQTVNLIKLKFQVTRN